MHYINDNLLYDGSLKSFQDAVNLASIVSVTDKQGNIIYANDLFCKISQYPLDYLIGKNHRILNSGHHSKEFFADLWGTISDGKPWRGEIKNRARDGSFYWVDSVITPVFNDRKEIVQYLSVRNVITEQKENENFKNSIFSALVIGIAVIDKNGKVVSANKAWSEFSERHTTSSFHADYGENYLIKCLEEIEKGNFDASKARAGIMEVLDGTSSVFEMQFRSFEDPELKFTSMHVTPFIGGGAVLTYYDITNEKKYQQEILESKDQLLSLSAKVAKLGYWEMEVEAERLNFTEELLRMFETNEIKNLDQYVSLVYRADQKQVRNNMLQAMQGDLANVEYRIITRNDKLKWLQNIPGGVNNSRGRTTIYGTIQDITNLKNYELELERSLEELSERYEALMQFSYIVSHNLRGPILNLIELSNLLQVADVDPKVRMEISTHISESCKKLDTVTRDLGQILSARSTSDKARENIRFAELAKQLESDLQHEISRSEAQIRWNISSDCPSFTTVKSYMESIFYNLLSNAIKYRSANRKLNVNIDINKPDNETLEIIFSDNGTGIDLQKNGGKIFNLYQRFHKNIEGKGLGLYMTKTQTEALGGHIGIQSEPEKGTTFILTFNNLNNEQQIYSH